MPIAETAKHCGRCRRTKSVAEFYSNRARHDGLANYCIACMGQIAIANRIVGRGLVIAALGGQCRRCGYHADDRAFQVDHVNGGGLAERRQGIPSSPAAVLRQIAADPAKFQLLCANCNIIKKTLEREFVGSRVYVRSIDTSGRTKRCHRCSQVKLASDFHQTVSRYDGLSGHCVECHREVVAEGYAKARRALVELLGGSCVTCGFDNPMALQVDHVNGNGGEERRIHGAKVATLVGFVTARPSEYQMLCANCNSIKKMAMGEQRGAGTYKRAPVQVRILKGRAASDALRITRANERQSALLVAVSARSEIERSPVRLPFGSWSRFFRRCIGCLRTDRKHSANGLCYACNSRAKGYTRRVRPDPALS